MLHAATLPAQDPQLLLRDQRTLVEFIRVYCHGQHDAAQRQPVELKLPDWQSLAPSDLTLCPECTRLLTHALVKRQHCTMDPKPQCKHCPNHCYHPRYRDMIRQVMRYSGMRLMLHGRVSYLLHLLF